MTKNNILSVVGVMVVCGLLVAGLGMWLGSPDTPEVEVVNKINEPLTGPLTADQLAAYQVDMTNKDNPVAVFNTNQGVIELELFEDTMPITAGNFEKLVGEGFYNGVKFHRVIDGFMIQGGDPITKTEEFLRYGTGGPGYSIADEHVAGEYLTNVRGTISMANSGPNSGGSQFFINLGDNTNLDFDKQPLSSKHPVFGRVITGMEVVDAIGKTEVNDRDLPVNDVVIESVVIERRG
jgi:peptidylprolyl isomerase